MARGGKNKCGKRFLFFSPRLILFFFYSPNRIRSSLPAPLCSAFLSDKQFVFNFTPDPPPLPPSPRTNTRGAPSERARDHLKLSLQSLSVLEVGWREDAGKSLGGG